MNSSSIRTITRQGSSRECPYCSREIIYTVIKLWDSPEPFFYCNSCNSLLMRESDRKRATVAAVKEFVSDADLEKVWLNCLTNAPQCSCGGRFEFWTNIKCTLCAVEFPYNDGVRDLHTRLYDQSIIVMDGATVLDDNVSKSWIANVVLKN